MKSACLFASSFVTKQKNECPMIVPCGIPPETKGRTISSQGHWANQLKEVLEKCSYVIRFFSANSGLSVTYGSRFFCEVFLVPDSNKGLGLTAGHAHSDASPSTPRKSLHWIRACKPLSSQPLKKQVRFFLRWCCFVTNTIEIQGESVYL